MNLVIVESPTKSKTISKFLGPEYKVLSSGGHILDLPKKFLGVEVENNFKPKYVIIPKAQKIVQILKKEAEKAQMCLLSTDPDREGEAIAYHLVFLLNLNGEKPYQRIVFHEITEHAIKEALKNPRKINMKLVEAQQARRILDRIVGYKLSPLLWKKITRRLSAGRVQSVALKLVVEREREIENFRPQEYWTIEVILKKSQISEKKNQEFRAFLIKKDGKKIPKLSIKNQENAEKIVKEIEGAKYKVIGVEKKEVKRSPLPPFTTSTLQQTAWQKFFWSAKMTMKIAQDLYEQGYITYHRTDSLNLSKVALKEAEKFIFKNYGQNYYHFRKYKTKSKLAQEAHEAIRPTNLQNYGEKISKKLNKNQLKLYDLIWKRFIASQMKEAFFDSTSVEILAKNYFFEVKGEVLKFDGFLRVYPLKFQEKEIPPLEKGEILELIKLIPLQHFTKPPSRYSEATLIKTLEKNGIGRPSTYAPILSNIQERNYIEKDENKKLKPTELGRVINDFLVKHFPEIVDINFTAKMEENLDKIALGNKDWISTLKEFYFPFAEKLEKKYKEISKEEIIERTNEVCPLCGGQVLIRLGKFGRFYACSKFPKCKYTKNIKENNLGIKCPKCQKGEILEKRTKRKKIFYGCSHWPECDFASWEKPLNEKFSE